METLHQDNAFFEIALENLPTLLKKLETSKRRDNRSFEKRIIDELTNNNSEDRACDIALSNKKFKTAISGIAKVKQFKADRVNEMKEDINNEIDKMEHTPGAKSLVGKIFRSILNNL